MNKPTMQNPAAYNEAIDFFEDCLRTRWTDEMHELLDLVVEYEAYHFRGVFDFENSVNG